MSRYKVVGTQPVLDHQPGESFEATIPGEQETFLISIGALERLPLEDRPAPPITPPKPPPIQGPWSQ